MLHYASPLPEVMHASRLQQMDHLPSTAASFESKSIILSSTWKKTMLGTTTAILSAIHRTFSVPRREIGSKLNLKINMVKKKKIFTKQMSMYCLRVPEVSRERRGVQPWLDTLLPTKQFNCGAQISCLSQSSE